MSKLNPDFIELIEADIKKAEDKAEVFKDTGVVKLDPLYTEEITEESVNKHIDFINRQGTILNSVTANIAHKNYDETKLEKWTGSMAIGDVTITSSYNIKEQVGEGDPIYGVIDTLFDYKHSDDLSAYHDHFQDLDKIRCENLFKD